MSDSNPPPGVCATETTADFATSIDNQCFFCVRAPGAAYVCVPSTRVCASCGYQCCEDCFDMLAHRCFACAVDLVPPPDKSPQCFYCVVCPGAAYSDVPAATVCSACQRSACAACLLGDSPMCFACSAETTATPNEPALFDTSIVFSHC